DAHLQRLTWITWALGRRLLLAPAVPWCSRTARLNEVVGVYRVAVRPSDATQPVLDHSGVPRVDRNERAPHPNAPGLRIRKPRSHASYTWPKLDTLPCRCEGFDRQTNNDRERAVTKGGRSTNVDGWRRYDCPTNDTSAVPRRVSKAAASRVEEQGVTDLKR